MTTTINASTTSGLVQTADTSGVLALQTAGTTAVTVDASQNVGIGTTSPVLTAANRGNLTINGSAGSILNLAYGGSAAALFYADNTLGKIGTYTSIPMLFTTADTERMRIDSSGRLLVGTTSDFTSGNVQGIAAQASGNASLALSRTTDTGAVARFYSTSTNVGRIDITGSATSYVTSSDYRLKENIAQMTGALDKVALLNPVTYTWKLDGSAGQGFIAHELQEIVPDAVSGEKDAVNEDGSINPQGIDTSFLVATLTKAIQEQQELIKQLQADVAELKGV